MLFMQILVWIMVMNSEKWTEGMNICSDFHFDAHILDLQRTYDVIGTGTWHHIIKYSAPDKEQTVKGGVFI